MFCSDCAVNLKTGASAKYDAPQNSSISNERQTQQCQHNWICFYRPSSKKLLQFSRLLNIFLTVVVCSHRAQASHTSRANPALTCLLSNPCFILPFAANVCLPPTHTLTSWTMELNRSAEARKSAIDLGL